MPAPDNDATPRFNIHAIGGLDGLFRVVSAFVQRVVRDPMIGFFFDGVDIQQLTVLEYEFAASHLGLGVEYTGRPIALAHRSRTIFDGQFDRRRQILKETLQAHSVPDEIQSAWLEHTEKLRSAVVHGDCHPQGPTP